MSRFGAGFGKDTMLLDGRPNRTFQSCQNQVTEPSGGAAAIPAKLLPCRKLGALHRAPVLLRCVASATTAVYYQLQRYIPTYGTVIRTGSLSCAHP